ncbi:VOC family protein [Plesiomonas shigelloides]|uniref:Glyoxalase/bleomycin resistance protein/dioxygenase n=1 Tax=Plesiomonas shigelloides 302-73 TaxID=1315976 RepID=R8AV35_PLESH|nr:VOC family protein [Plesiomonas shigelloides]EON90198.1 Glyoxalase/bleomycin resistance protein/dioxygenase [Plesiomonas shigelloides 302-73]
MLTPCSLDHLVLTVQDIERTVDFYQDILGMRAETFGKEQRTALHFGEQKINLHPAARPIQPCAATPMPGSADLCLLTKTPLDEAMRWVKANGVQIEEGPVQRTGATGPLLSFYIRDPDGNLIEIANRLVS